MVYVEVDHYIDKTVKELNLPPLVVRNQLLFYDKFEAKLKHDWIK